MKYTLATLAVIVSGCAAGNTATRSEDYSQRSVLETKTVAVEQRLSPQEEALQSLREQGAVIDDTLQCAPVSRDSFRQDFNEIEQKGKAEYTALEKLLSARGEDVFGWTKSNQYRRLVTVKKDKEGNYVPVSADAPAKVYAYTQLNSWEAYGGARDVFCVQASAPLDLVVTGTYKNLNDAILAVKQAHAADEERVDQEMKVKGEATKKMIKQRALETKRQFEEMRKEVEERTRHYQQGSQDGVETYHSEHEQQRREWYEQQGTMPTAPQGEKGQKKESPAPEIKPDGEGSVPTGGYKQKKEEIRRQFERDRDEIRRQFERDREEIRRQYEEERRKILGE